MQQGAKELDLALAEDLHTEETVGQWVDHHVRVVELTRDRRWTVITLVLRVHNVHNVVSDVSFLFFFSKIRKMMKIEEREKGRKRPCGSVEDQWHWRACW